MCMEKDSREFRGRTALYAYVPVTKVVTIQRQQNDGETTWKKPMLFTKH